MRKRFALLWTPFVVVMALMLPGAVAAGSPGKVATSSYCSGNNTVNATAKVTKYSGLYASKLTMTVQGQGYQNGSWQNEHNFGTYTKWVYTSAKATMTKTFTFNPGHSGRHRIRVVGKIWDGGNLLAKGSVNTPACV